MEILLSNDDGVYAEGIAALFTAMSAIEKAHITVVAPLEERSTTGHTLSLTNPLRLVHIKENFYGCSGYPADCVILAIGEIYHRQGKRPDLVISGINKGANLGTDIYYSGTAAAAREAIFQGVPAIAISSTVNMFDHLDSTECFATAADFVKKLVQSGIHKKLSPYTFININVPNLRSEEIKGVRVTRLGWRKYSEQIEARLDFRQRPYYWIVGNYITQENGEYLDGPTILNGEISITVLNLLHRQDDTEDKIKAFIKELYEKNIFKFN